MSGRAAIAATFIRRDWAIERSYRAPFVLQFASLLTMLTLFYFLSKVIDSDEFSKDYGLEGGYFEFVAIGLVVFQIVQNSLSSFSHKLALEQTTGTLEALLATPAGPATLVLASAAYEIIRATIEGLVVFIVALVFFDLALDASFGEALIGLAALAGCVLLFAAIGVALGAFTIVFKQTAGLLTLVLIVLPLLGGVYFPLEVLPGPLEELARALPLAWGLDVLRAALLGGEVDHLELTGLLAAGVLLLPLALFIFARAVERGRRTGTLAHY